MNSPHTQTEDPEPFEETGLYFPTGRSVELDDADSIARYPARVVRDAIETQERLWGRGALLQETAACQD